MSNDSSEPEQSHSKTRVLAGALKTLFLAGMFVLVPQIFAGVIVGLYGWDFENLTLAQTNILNFWSVISPAALLIWFYIYKNRPLGGLGVKMPTLRQFGLVIPAFLGYFLTTGAVLSLVTVLLPEVDLNEVQDLGLNQPSDNTGLAAIFLMLVVLTPITEELLFRGFLFGRFNKIMPFAWAAALSSALFGAAHLQLNVALDVTVMGIFSAWLLHKTKSIVPSIALHTLKNGIAFLLIFILEISI